jgi:hypothetical protein
MRNGIYNTATGAISLTGIQFKTVAFMEQVPLVIWYLEYRWFWNMDINTNKIISCSNTGTGIFGITNSAIVSAINLNNNIIRNLNKTASLGAFGYFEYGAVLRQFLLTETN